MIQLTDKELAKKIQHTNVNPELTEQDILSLCKDCVDYGFDGVMLQPAWVPTAVDYLKGTDVKVCTALGYPMGGELAHAKAYQAKKVFELGADQLDFMANIGFLKSGWYDRYREEIKGVVDAAEGKVTKIMLEFGMLTQDEKKRAAQLAIEAGVTYVKNSSGWGKGGHAEIEDIKLLKEIAGDRALVKASGGIRSREQALAFIEAGASLLGTSAGVAILSGKVGEKGVY